MPYYLLAAAYPEEQAGRDWRIIHAPDEDDAKKLFSKIFELDDRTDYILAELEASWITFVVKEVKSLEEKEDD